MYTTTGVLHLTLQSVTYTSIRLIVYIGTSSDLFCYSATLDTKGNKNVSDTTFVPMSKMEKMSWQSPLPNYSKNALASTATPNYL